MTCHTNIDLTSKVGLTWHVGNTPDEISFKVLKAALANGAHVWNSADFYGTPDEANGGWKDTSLHFLNQYFTAHPENSDKVVLSVKSGLVSMKTFEIDSSADGIRKCVNNANKILDGKKKIDLFGMA
ncbi:hypothetical protein MMC13_006277 [Lambiella insularis]|nr:hypothetical protein [Lambiella insularis]